MSEIAKTEQSGSREIEAMAEINELLELFDNKARRRMLEWVIAYQADLRAGYIPSPSRGD